MVCAEMWYLEITLIFAGIMGVIALDAQAIILNLVYLLYMIPLGM